MKCVQGNQGDRLPKGFRQDEKHASCLVCSSGRRGCPVNNKALGALVLAFVLMTGALPTRIAKRRACLMS